MSLPWDYSQYGVPILRNAQIEELAEKVLRKYGSSTIEKPGKAPIMEMFLYLIEKHQVKLSLTPLGKRGDYRIRGRIHFQENIICLDKDAFDEASPMFFFAGAHEIGHWFLHRHRPIIEDDKQQPIGALEDDTITLQYHHEHASRTSRAWIELQANKFAAALLMPQQMMREAIILIQEDMGITRNQGVVYVNPDADSQRDFKALLTHFQEIFGTSKTALRYRLENLGMLIENR